MTIESGGEAAVVETVTTPAPEAGFSSQEPAQSGERDFEAEARDMGWRPKEEWTGKPEHWKDAKTYVEFDVVANRLTKAEREFNERLAKMEKVNARTVEKLQRQHAQEMAELTATRKEAIKAGDVDAVEHLDQQIADLKADAPEAGPKPRERMSDAERQQADNAAQEAWVAKQDWWNVDEDLTALAIGISQRLTKPGMSMEENLKLTEAALAKKYPDRFGGKSSGANGHASVDGGGFAPGGVKTDPLSKLPNEARAQAKADMAKFPKMYPSAEAWIKAYNS
jgi:hypothetical protein